MITLAEAREKVNSVVGKWGKREVEAARVLPSGDVILVADTPKMARALRERPGWEQSLRLTAKQRRPRFTVLVKHVARDAIDCSNQEVAVRTILDQNKRLHGVVKFAHIG